MKEKMLARFKFSDELKEKLVTMVVYQNRLPKELAKQYGLPNVHMQINWVNIYKRTPMLAQASVPVAQLTLC